MRYTANFSMKEPQKNIDLADVEDLNDNFEDIDEIMHNAQISIADAYDSTQTYDVDDVVMYEGLLYKCITAISVAEAWDSTKWERTTAATSGGGGNANVTEITYSQYSALTPAEKANGTIYMVTNDPNDSSGGGGGGGVDYSTTEQYTGIKWIDGKDIYQKTIFVNGTITLNNTATTIPSSYFDVSMVDTFTNALAVRITKNNQGTCVTHASAWKDGTSLKVYGSTTVTNVDYITVQYTKVYPQA